jgi:hypothetical protein
VNFLITFHLISGMSVGVEYVPGTEEYLPSFLIDLLILRVIFSLDNEPEEDVDS